MHYKLALAIVVPAILCTIDASTAQALNHQLVEERSEPTARITRDAVATVEANRPKLIARMVDQYRTPLEAHSITLDAFRAALYDLAPDRLLAASLADSIEEVNTIIAQAIAGPSRPDAKDGPGTGANSWIGFTAGSNQASGTGSAVAAGTNNVASGQNAFVGAGTFNAATAQGAFVGGGTSNVAAGISSLVIGGFDNQSRVIDALVVAGAGNRATGARSVVVGGGYNLASGQWSFIGGGGRQTNNAGGAGTFVQDHVAAGDFSTIGGGQGNRAGTAVNPAETAYATVGGGEFNTANDFASVVSGGLGNTASGDASTVGGGVGNTASGESSTVAGGESNTASGDFSTVAGGNLNTASGGGGAGISTGQGNTASGFTSTIAGGNDNAASGNFSFVGGGANNFAVGDYSVALGRAAHANTNGSFVFSDGNGATFASDINNTFMVGATGGIGMWTSKTFATGCFISAGGGGWNCTSSREVKRDFADVNTRAVLDKVVALPMTTWRFMNEADSIRHLGPMAQDFRAAFGLGPDDKTIGMSDANGVAFAAIQGLNQRVDEKNIEIAQLRRELDAIKRKLGM